MSILYSRLCNSLQRIKCLSFAEVLFTFSGYKLHWRTFYSYIETRQDVLKRIRSVKKGGLFTPTCNAILQIFLLVHNFFLLMWLSSTRIPFSMGKKLLSRVCKQINIFKLSPTVLHCQSIYQVSSVCKKRKNQPNNFFMVDSPYVVIKLIICVFDGIRNLDSFNGFTVNHSAIREFYLHYSRIVCF